LHRRVKNKRLRGTGQVEIKSLCKTIKLAARQISLPRHRVIPKKPRGNAVKRSIGFLIKPIVKKTDESSTGIIECLLQRKDVEESIDSLTTCQQRRRTWSWQYKI
jgi:hypothetical protein